MVEEFKRGINRGIRRKLMKAENPLASIEQWYKRATALNRNWRKSRRKEKRLRGKETTRGASKQEQRQILPQLLVWQWRQMPPQQAITGPAEGAFASSATLRVVA